jgi:hypothetical protein
MGDFARVLQVGNLHSEAGKYNSNNFEFYSSVFCIKKSMFSLLSV